MGAKKDNMPRIKKLVNGRAVGVCVFVWDFFPHHLQAGDRGDGCGVKKNGYQKSEMCFRKTSI